APYRHFAGKQALLAAVAEQGFRDMTAAMRHAAAGHVSDPAARFRVLGLAYVAFAATHRSHFRVMFGLEAADKSSYPGLRAAAEEAYGLLLEAIRDCRREGLLAPGDPSEQALAAWSVVHGLSVLIADRQLVDLKDRPADELAAIVTRNLFLGLSVRPV
ncbi:MAG: TetR-like C-terminal domain-containing protein, partial [Candidatus Binataceae bacterium]